MTTVNTYQYSKKLTNKQMLKYKMGLYDAIDQLKKLAVTPDNEHALEEINISNDVFTLDMKCNIPKLKLLIK